MKLLLQIILKIFLILTFLSGFASSEEIKETDPAVLLNQGTMYFDKGEYDRAIAYLSKAIEINPKHTKAYYYRGRAYLNKGEYDKAIADCTKAIEINPKNEGAYINRGFAYLNKVQYGKAISDYSKAIEISPNA